MATMYKFRPGERLNEIELARQLGVSRAPLREALPRLEAEGIVVLNPRRGYSVVSLDPQEIREIFELRALIEETTVREATRQRSDDDVARLRELVARMDALPGPDAGLVSWFDLHARFHDALIAPSGRRHFIRTITGLRAVVEPYIRVEVGLTGDVAEAQHEHRELTEAFAAGDADTVARLTRTHIQHTAQRLLAGLAASAASAASAERAPGRPPRPYPRS
jgi:DNA-binding GntR family transcriptional regulator